MTKVYVVFGCVVRWLLSPDRLAATRAACGGECACVQRERCCYCSAAHACLATLPWQEMTRISASRKELSDEVTSAKAQLKNRAKVRYHPQPSPVRARLCLLVLMRCC